MAQADAKAVWVAQAWFLSRAPVLKPSPGSPWGWQQLEAFLLAPPHGRLLMLDLNAVANPVWKRTRSFLGVPFIWCAIENFGGRSGLFSTSLQTIADGPAESLASAARNESSIVGVGMTPEGIETNPLVFNLIAETFWHSTPIDVDAWSWSFVRARYRLKHTRSAEVAQAALKQLVASVYDASAYQWKGQGAVGSAVASFPSFKPSIPDTSCSPYYDTNSLETAWTMLLSLNDELSNCSGYQYDLVALGEAVASNRFLLLLMNLQKDYTAKNVSAVQAGGRELLELILDLDRLLRTSPSHLLGTYLLAAESTGNTPKEVAMFRASAKRMITLWGYPFRNQTYDSHLSEYAYRLWAGLVSTYYYHRWAFFVQVLQKSLDTGKPIDANFSTILINWEQSWIANASINSSSVGTVPLGSTVDVAKALHQKWVASVEPAHALWII
jgi:alpha-N-acetylglucosaminidase